MAPGPGRPLAVFDFDHTLVDANSDTYILEVLDDGLHTKCLSLSRSVQWTELMDRMTQELHANGFRRSDMAKALSSIPMHESIPTMLRTLHEAGFELAILSDANAFYIDATLDARGLRPLFAHVITNPVHWEQPEGPLRVRRRVEAHTCRNRHCSVNICKGQEIDQLLLQPAPAATAASASGPAAAATATATEALAAQTACSGGAGAVDAAACRRRVFYFGDGANDHCPATRLGPGDVVFAREGYRLEKVLQGDAAAAGAVRARVVYWRQGDDLLQAVREALAQQ